MNVLHDRTPNSKLNLLPPYPQDPSNHRVQQHHHHHHQQQKQQQKSYPIDFSRLHNPISINRDPKQQNTKY